MSNYSKGTNVSREAVRAFYKTVPREALPFLYLKMNYDNIHALKIRLLGVTKLSLTDFLMIQSFFDEWNKSHRKTFPTYNGVFDRLQTSLYYQRLIEYINSNCFQRLGKPAKDKVTAEQIRIYKQLQNG